MVDSPNGSTILTPIGFVVSSHLSLPTGPPCPTLHNVTHFHLVLWWCLWILLLIIVFQEADLSKLKYQYINSHLLKKLFSTEREKGKKS